MKHQKVQAQESNIYDNNFKMSVWQIVFEKIDFDQIAQTNLSRHLIIGVIREVWVFKKTQVP